MKQSFLAHCPSCDADNVSLVGPIPDSYGFGGRYFDKPITGGHLVRCDDCGLQFRYPQLSKADLDQLYLNSTTEIWQYPTDGRPDWEIASRLINSENSCRSVLDVGCFDGNFLRQLGPHFRLAGIEIHPEAAQRARDAGVQIVGSDLACLEELDEQYDVVVAFDVIEHVSDPKAFLASLIRVAKPDGLIIIATGNTASLPWRMMRGQYWYCAIAEHIAFINPSWCKRAAGDLHLSVTHIANYTRKPASFRRASMHAMANLLFLLAPRLAAHLKGLLKRLVQGRGNPESPAPPVWLAAADHFLVSFRKMRSA
jgi:2-polyprenyl-3-methyl-5-hydroxy-6-metoxy-1,4-benzoquinol methylase